MPELNAYIEAGLEELKARLSQLPAEPPRSYDELDELFLRIIRYR